MQLITTNEIREALADIQLRPLEHANLAEDGCARRHIYLYVLSFNCLLIEADGFHSE
jgi:hypothetical protein